MKNILYRISWVLLFLASSTVNAKASDQHHWLELAKEHAENNLSDSAKHYLDRTLQSHTLANDTSAWVLAVGTIGRIHSKNKSDWTVKHYKHYLLEAKRLFGENHVVVAELYARLGDVYRKPWVGRLYESLKYFNESIRIYEAHGIQSRLVGFIYHFAGNIYTRLGSYSKAINYLQKSLHIRLKTHDSLYAAQVYNDLGIAYTDLEQYAVGLDHYILGIQTTQASTHSRKSSLLYATLLLNKSDNFLKSERPADVVSMLQPALKIFEEYDDLSGLNAVYQSMGHWFLSSGNKEKGLHYLKKGLQLAKRKYGMHNRELAKVWVEMAEYFQSQNQSKLALAYTDSALASLIEDFETNENFHNPSPTQLYAEPWLLIILETKANILCGLYDGHGDYSYLEKGQSTFLLAVQAMDLLRDAYVYGEDKERLFSSYHTLFEGALSATVRLADLSSDSSLYRQAFQLQQKSKSYSLLEQYRGIDAQTLLQIPDSLIQKERALKAKLSELKLEIKARNSSTTVNIELVHVKSQFENLVADIQKSYPAYFDLKYADENLGLALVQDSVLDQNEMLVQYSLQNDQLICFITTPNSFKVTTIPITPSFFKSLAEYNALLATPNFDQSLDKSVREMAFAGHALYTKLYAPIADVLNKADQPIDRLIIEPDGALNYLPFETLVSEPHTSETEFAHLAFLTKKYSVVYAYSVSTLFHQQKLKRSKKSVFNIQAFAPQFEGALSLDYNKEELENIEELIKGQFHYDAVINKPFFVEQMGTAKILHLATHASLNDSVPLHSHLLLGKSSNNNANRIYAYELYNMPIGADLVVLSACNTGNGQLVKGEGIISLSRGFAHAQCRSTIMSLWQVNDFATASLMKHFYHYLKNGQTKDEALNLAKLQLLEQTKGIKGHPYFWAGFVLNGDHNAIHFESSFWHEFKWLLGLAGVILLALGILLRKRSHA